MKKFLRKNWLGLLSSFITLVSIAVALLIYIRSQESREPVFIVDPNRTEIISAERVSDAPLKIVRAEGGEITGDITSVRVYLWNRGKLSIKPENILRPLRFTLNDPEGEILDFRILKYSREVIALEVERYPQDPKRVLSVDFKILEQDDGFCLQIIYVGSPSSDVTIDGQVEGVPYPIGASQIEAKRFWVVYVNKIMGFAVFLIVPVIVIPCFLIIIFVSRYVDKMGGRVQKFLIACAIMSAILFAIVFCIWGLILNPVNQAKKEARQTLVESVPASIVPRLSPESQD